MGAANYQHQEDTFSVVSFRIMDFFQIENTTIETLTVTLTTSSMPQSYPAQRDEIHFLHHAPNPAPSKPSIR